MSHLLFICVGLLSGLLLTLMSYKMFQILQLSSYKTKGLINWFKISKGDYIIRYFAAAFFAFISMMVYVSCFFLYAPVKYLGFILFAAVCILFIYLTLRTKAKKPLVFTGRACRLVVITFILNIGLCFGLLELGAITAVKYSLLGLAPLFIPIMAILAHFITLPFELINNRGYRLRAMRKLSSMPGLIKIGITGSYGKTTAKNILAEILSKKYKVCYSPSSYNTPMGISKVINNSLSDDDRIFIAEMGARNRGDIAELSRIVSPNYGIITAIGNQHLETFGNRETIIATKNELVENLEVGGLAVFNGDSPDVIGMYDRASIAKEITGADSTEKAHVVYSNVKVGTLGTQFTLKAYDKSVEISTVLLGKHIPSLITLCAVVALRLGLTLNEIADACSSLEPVEHRLQLIKNGDTTIIDDSYNCNTEGAKNALLLLKEFDVTKIIITPGMVELGIEEKESNIALGSQIADAADYAYLVGSRCADIKKGALEAGMAEDKIFIVESLAEAVEKQQQILGKKVILFENDLPDNY